jgi:hypothetical protein
MMNHLRAGTIAHAYLAVDDLQLGGDGSATWTESVMRPLFFPPDVPVSSDIVRHPHRVFMVSCLRNEGVDDVLPWLLESCKTNRHYT